MIDTEIDDLELNELLEMVEKVEQDYRQNKISEEEIMEFMKKVAKKLNISEKPLDNPS